MESPVRVRRKLMLAQRILNQVDDRATLVDRRMREVVGLFIVGFGGWALIAMHEIAIVQGLARQCLVECPAAWVCSDHRRVLVCLLSGFFGVAYFGFYRQTSVAPWPGVAIFGSATHRLCSCC